MTDFDEQDLTPENIHYEGDANSIDPDHGDLEVTPEMGDNYIGAEIMTPGGGVFSRGRVIRRKRDSEGNPVGRSHTNLVLDTQSYIVELDILWLSGRAGAKRSRGSGFETAHFALKVLVQPGFESLLDAPTYALSLCHAPSRFRLARGVTDGRLHLCLRGFRVSGVGR